MKLPKGRTLTAASLKTLKANAIEAARRELFLARCKQLYIPLPIVGYKFALPARKFAFDFAWLDRKIALEAEGGAWTSGRHTRGAGFVRDMDKYSEAAVLGWCVLRVESALLASDETFTLLRRAFEARPIPIPPPS